MNYKFMEVVNILKSVMDEIDDPWSMKDTHEKLDALRDAANSVVNEAECMIILRQSGGQIAEAFENG